MNERAKLLLTMVSYIAQGVLAVVVFATIVLAVLWALHELAP